MARWVVAALVVALALFALDRALLGAESRGWIYYRRNRPRLGSASTGVLTVMSIYQPGYEHLVNERLRIAADIEDIEDDEPLR